MTCLSCRRDLPRKRFAIVTSTYITVKGEKRINKGRRKKCNSCTWGRKYKKKKETLTCY